MGQTVSIARVDALGTFPWSDPLKRDAIALLAYAYKEHAHALPWSQWIMTRALQVCAMLSAKERLNLSEEDGRKACNDFGLMQRRVYHTLDTLDNWNTVLDSTIVALHNAGAATATVRVKVGDNEVTHAILPGGVVWPLEQNVLPLHQKVPIQVSTDAADGHVYAYTAQWFLGLMDRYRTVQLQTSERVYCIEMDA